MADETTFVYKYQWENEFQWKARRVFIQTHEAKFEDRRLASLSNAWANWRFHGCTYCRPVQAMLNELDQELPTEVQAALGKIPSHKGLSQVKFQKSSESGQKSCSVLSNRPFQGFTIYEPRNPAIFNPISVLTESAQKSKKTIEFHYLGLKEDENKTLLHATAVAIEGAILGTGMAGSKRDSKRNCASKALEILRTSVPVKLPVDHNSIENVEKGKLVKSAFQNAKKIDDTNIGSVMLRNMGWTGDGGLTKTGIAEPVFLESSDRRKGFGHELSFSIRKSAVEETLLRFIRESADCDIKFSSDLSKDDRALIHRLCRQYGLKHKSFGKGNERYLIVSKK